MKRTFFVVVQQRDNGRTPIEFDAITSEEVSRLPLDLDHYPESGATLLVVHANLDAARDAAIRLAREMGMPPDTYPELWGNIGVCTYLPNRHTPVIIRK